MSTADELVSRLPRTLFIGGRWSDDPTPLEVTNPATGRALTSVADASPEQGVAALDAAVAAQADWAATDPRERAEILRRAFDLVVRRTDDFALCMTLEMGKPLAESRGEVTYGAEFIRWFSEEAVRVEGRYSRAPSGGSRIITVKQPVGPVYAITPWNFPLAMATRKIGPALAAGCTIVIKPASQTPLTTMLFMTVLEEAGLPAGVVNCITTSHSGPVSEAIIGDPRLRKLTFTGSTEVGRSLLGLAAGGILRTSMELGGNAPFVVLPSADLDKAVDGAVLAKMRNVGEACTAANRFIVHESLAEEFSTRLAGRLGAMKVGDGTAEGVEVGPLINSGAVSHIEELIADAVDHGATVLTGGQRLSGGDYGDGNFLAPTVLTGVSPDSRCLHEEIFGPVAPVTAFSTIDEAVALANDTEFGLIGYVFGEQLTEALTVAERLETGMIGLNSGVVSNPAAPFGGVKASGLGREGSHEGIEEYLETKYIGLSLG